MATTRSILQDETLRGLHHNKLLWPDPCQASGTRRDSDREVASLIHPDLFGLFTVCLMKPYPGVFEIKTYADMDVFKAEYADACEILGSVLGGTYGRGQ